MATMNTVSKLMTMRIGGGGGKQNKSNKNFTDEDGNNNRSLSSRLKRAESHRVLSGQKQQQQRPSLTAKDLLLSASAASSSTTSLTTNLSVSLSSIGHSNESCGEIDSSIRPSKVSSSSISTSSISTSSISTSSSISISSNTGTHATTDRAGMYDLDSERRRQRRKSTTTTRPSSSSSLRTLSQRNMSMSPRSACLRSRHHQDDMDNGRKESTLETLKRTYGSTSSIMNHPEPQVARAAAAAPEMEVKTTKKKPTKTTTSTAQRIQGLDCFFKEYDAIHSKEYGVDVAEKSIDGGSLTGW